MRERFETSTDRTRERAAAAALSRAWRCTMVKAAPLAGWDYTCHRGGRALAVVEVKARLNREPADFGATLFLNEHKVRDLRAAAEQLAARQASPVVALFAWHFPSVILWVDVTGPMGWPLELRGRTDRDGRDVCPAYRIPLRATRAVRVDPYEVIPLT